MNFIVIEVEHKIAVRKKDIKCVKLEGTQTIIVFKDGSFLMVKNAFTEILQELNQ